MYHQKLHYDIFSDIVIVDHGLIVHDLRKEMEMMTKLLPLFSAILFDMKLLD